MPKNQTTQDQVNDFVKVMEKLETPNRKGIKVNWAIITMDAMMLFIGIQAKNQPAIMLAVQNLLTHLGYPPPDNFPTLSVTNGQSSSKA